ncbi:MAG TPA: CDP-alcohol phosphatidyltransferase family protein [Gemmatimonadales bacterium]|nr:CDP-alcohol phosphatidyltransferase family protein [Gemmatimonadales bacterium]
MKPPSDLSHKGAAVEEWVDLRFFRPVGIRIARALEPTGISADQVTLWSILVGLVAGHLFLYRDPWVNAIGFALFILSDVFDSADGQLARLRGTSTRLGRLLDGVGDNVRFVNLYGHLAVRLVLAGWHWPGVLLAAVAGLSHSVQSMAIDFIRNAYLAIGEGAGGELDLPEDLPPAQGTRLERFGARVYGDYIRRQTQLFPRTVDLLRVLRRIRIPGAFRAAYRDRQQPLLPLCSWLGQNIRFALIGVAGIAGYPAAYLWTEVLAMNLVLFAVLLPSHETNSASLLSSLEREASAH